MVKIKIDFGEVGHPTAKQIDFVQEICRVLRLKKPEFTFEAYSNFISDYVDDFYYEQELYNRLRFEDDDYGLNDDSDFYRQR